MSLNATQIIPHTHAIKVFIKLPSLINMSVFCINSSVMVISLCSLCRAVFVAPGLEVGEGGGAGIRQGESNRQNRTQEHWKTGKNTLDSLEGRG